MFPAIGGKTWEVYSKAKPSLEAFTFTAKQDGIYWFSVAVIDQNGRQEPADIYKAAVGQKVLIDTIRPEVQLKGERKGDEVHLKWGIRENNLDLDSIKLECKAGNDGSEEWVPIVIKPVADGTGSFKQPGGEHLTIRMQVKDSAGNMGLAVEDVLSQKPVENLASFGVPKATSIVESPGQTPRPNIPISIPEKLVDKKEPTTFNVPPLGNNIASNLVPPIPGPGQDPIQKEKLDTQISPPPLTNVPVFPASRNATPLDPFQTQLTSPIPTSPVVNSLPPVLASSANTPQGPENQVVTQAEPRRASPTIQVVNKKSVRIDLEVAKYGPSGIGLVEVYSTVDEGNSWVLAHSESPVISASPEGKSIRCGVYVPIPQEGVAVGYFVIVKSKAGLGKSPPQKGDAPNIRVELDTTPAEAVLYSPQPKVGQSNALVLSWKAVDKNIGPDPVLLEWSEKRDGPWNLIGEGNLPNTGNFTWILSPAVPHKVFLKLTVRDIAGNVAVAQTPEPLLLDLQIPEVNVLGISPSGR